MQNDTIFDKIIREEIPATKVYEDEEFFAFLDINPIAKGHTLLITKESFVWMEEIPNETLSSVFVLAKQIMLAMRASLECDYVQVVVEGTGVPHFHIHLIPSMSKNKNAVWEHTKYTEGEKEIFAEKIKSGLK